MPKERSPFSEAQILELEHLRKSNKDKNVDRRVRALLMYTRGERSEETARQTGFSKEYIKNLVSKYRVRGLSAVTGDNYKGNHRNMSFADEEALLSSFKEAAESGQVIEVKEIKRVYEEKIGRSLSSTGQIYNVLHRHGWRKIKPRSQHPNKASEEEIESSKKLSAALMS
jgi:transposase